jgi:hypothetical protein
MGKLRCTICNFSCNKPFYLKNHMEMIHNRTNVGMFASHQLIKSYEYFLTNQVAEENKLRLNFFFYNHDYDTLNNQYAEILDYRKFNELDTLIIEINSLTNQASSTNIIKYALEKNPNMKIIKVCQIDFLIFPINWNSQFDKSRNYKNWRGAHKINFKSKFRICINSLYRHFKNTDYDTKIIEFIKSNFHNQLLFTSCTYPTNILLCEMWKCLFSLMNIDFDKYNFASVLNEKELLNDPRPNPFTTKMISDLDITFNPKIDDKLYNKRYRKNTLHINRPIITFPESTIL